ncbi:TMEM175 family protein [Dermatobacter hominis]|uniref:TMEM175 family protein n=1 Tax=Dermatobacter hominis TaxID=2884263 RepID=UPI001D1213C2|nr:TMEM175 family protein [Dermatobacter hominis]UDY36883.1 DUF1211 domain-containing protein [Dermatobacter hominis]
MATRPDPFRPPKRFDRDQVEFGRSLAFIDATFAIAATLLVVTLNPSDADWASWSRFLGDEWPSLLSFALSFLVISVYWWANHRLVAVLDTLSSRFVGCAVAMLAFVALLPFTTEGLGEYQDGGDGTVATVCYAGNVALVSILSTVLVVVSFREHLYRVQPTERELRAQLIDLADTPLVFLLSIPVTVLISPNWGRATWALLFVTGPLTGRWSARYAGRR